MPEFSFEGHRIAYGEHGEGDRVLVLIHGLLMDRRMYGWLAPEMASRGYRVLTIDLLGHGESDQPAEMFPYSMTRFGEQVVALLDHLGVEEAVVGGTSLGANTTLEVAALAPERVRAMVVEMPVLENALLFAALVFTPLAVSIHLARPGMRLLAAVARRIPRTFLLADIVLDWLRRDPEPSEAVLLGLIHGRVAPPRDERTRLTMPAMVIGHPMDPLHPFTDADMLTAELPDARLVNAASLLEWRTRPNRLNGELDAFLGEVWASGDPATGATAPTRAETP